MLEQKSALTKIVENAADKDTETFILELDLNQDFIKQVQGFLNLEKRRRDEKILMQPEELKIPVPKKQT